MTTTQASPHALSLNIRSPRSRSPHFTPTIRSAPWCASASRSTTRRLTPRSTGSVARSSELRSSALVLRKPRSGCLEGRPRVPSFETRALRAPQDEVRGFLLLALRDRPCQQPGGRTEKQDDEDEQPARCLGQRGGSFFLGFVTDHEDLVVRAFGRLADQSALLHLAKHKGRNVACKHVLLAPVGRI